MNSFSFKGFPEGNEGVSPFLFHNDSQSVPFNKKGTTYHRQSWNRKKVKTQVVSTVSHS